MPLVELIFDAESHSADAIQRAAYRFADRFSLELTRDDANYHCRLHFVTDVDETVVNGFRVEVLDHVLRERIRIETEGTRNVVLALAFSNTSLSDE